MRSLRLPRSLKIYLSIVGALLMVACITVAFTYWLRQQPDHSSIEWSAIEPPSVLRDWRYIVIHHSDTLGGSTSAIDKHHREVNRWDGIGYHFVIGNGHGMRSGRVDYTFRWDQQREGAHAGGTDKSYNENGIGICLIGNFEQQAPDPYQLARCATLCACLIESIPELRIENIIGHRDVPGKHTKCPGDHFDLEAFREQVRTTLARRAQARLQAVQEL